MILLEKVMDVINNIFRNKRVKHIEAAKGIINNNEKIENESNSFKESLEVHFKMNITKERSEAIIETLKCIHDRFRLSKIQKILKEE